jgi:hypothetical protein
LGSVNRLAMGRRAAPRCPHRRRPQTQKCRRRARGNEGGKIHAEAPCASPFLLDFVTYPRLYFAVPGGTRVCLRPARPGA